MKYLILFFLCFNLHAQLIEFVVPGSAGGSDDLTSRSIASTLEANTDLRFVIVNKPGAAHNIGYTYMKLSNKPSIMLATDAIIKNKTIAKEGYPDGILEVLTPIFYVGDFSNVLFVSSNSNIKSIEDLIQLSKKREIKFGHGGIGTYSHKSITRVCSEILICLDIPYKSGANSLLDLMNSNIDAYSYVSNNVNVYLENISLRPIMVFSNTNHPNINVPLLPKQYKNLEIKNWLLLFGKNLNDKQVEIIASSLKNKQAVFYFNMGLWYEYKDPAFIWRKELKESKTRF